MTTTASLDSTSVSLDPGSEAVVPLQIRNNGPVVEGYEISVIGVPSGWAVVEPSEISLYPGTATTATVTFRPPRSARTPAGAQAFGVKVQPTEHPELTVVPEGVVEILPFLETTAELIPRTSQGRRGRHKVAIDNRGNVPVSVLVEAVSDGERAQLTVDPVGLTIQPGEARFVGVKAKARPAIWRGEPVTHPFVVAVSPQDSTPVELDGSYVQTPVVPKWLWWALAALLLLLAALVAFWFLLLQPTIESQAKEAAEESAQQAEAAAADAEQSADDAGGAAEDAAQSAADAQQENDQNAPKDKNKVDVFDVSPRLNVITAGTDTDTFDLAGENDVFSLTDVVFSNPQGDFGRVQLIVDDDVRMEHALENFRDLDFHFVSPIEVSDDVTLRVQCRSPGEPPDAPKPTTCDVAVLLGGQVVSPRP